MEKALQDFSSMKGPSGTYSITVRVHPDGTTDFTIVRPNTCYISGQRPTLHQAAGELICAICEDFRTAVRRGESW